MRLILASASPRRHELLRQAGFPFTVEVAGINEDPLPGEGAAAYVERLAVEKAQAVSVLHRESLVLAADTCVVVDGSNILGKPVSPADAERMLRMLSGRTHAVMTGVAAVCSGPPGASACTVSDVEITQVTFNLLLEPEIERYVASGEPMDKAGGYAIQGYAARWIPRIEGDYFNVVGLPIARVVQLLAEAESQCGL